MVTIQCQSSGVTHNNKIMSTLKMDISNMSLALFKYYHPKCEQQELIEKLQQKNIPERTLRFDSQQAKLRNTPRSIK